MKQPGPDHPITITPNPRRVRVRLHGVIADTAAAQTLREASYPPVQYVPKADADMTRLEPSAHRTTCPYKGEASYFTILDGERRLENAVWCYEDPYPAAAAIRGHLAFYPDKVEAIEEADG